MNKKLGGNSMVTDTHREVFVLSRNILMHKKPT